MALAVPFASAQRASAEGIWAECVSGSVAGNCQESVWYSGPVAVVWHATPPPLETTPCLLEDEYPLEADIVESLTCTATWKGGGSDTRNLTVHVEVSSPTTEGVAERPPDSNGWFNHPVAITFKGHGYSGPASCRTSNGTPTITYAGPDTAGTSVDATCVDPAGKSVLASYTLRYDATPPTITGAFATRPPDLEGWYNHPVTFAFTGIDSASGFELCNATYAGPDSAKAALIATCRDVAGNVATYPVSLRYEGSAPTLSVAASSGDGFVSLRMRSDTSVEVTRSPGLHGSKPSRLYRGSSRTFTDTHCRDGATYTYTIKAKGRAGTLTQRSLSLKAGPHLLAPAVNAVLSSPPLLRWTPVKGASYYNVQLFRGGKLLSSWPVHTSLQLSRSWHYNGAEQRWAAGHYKWYVWPGYGPLGSARYGSLIGSGTFVVHSG